MSITTLPSELLLQILQNILEFPDSSSQDLLNCAITCRFWSYCALQLLWHKPLILKPQTWIKFRKTLSVEESRTYIPYAPLVRRINLSAVSDFISDEALETLSVCKQLDRVTLTGCSYITDNGIIDFLSKDVGKYLLSMDLSEIKNITDDTIFMIAKSCKRLQGLNLSVNPVKEECIGITDKSIVMLAESCRDLRRIRLSNWKMLTDESIIALTKYCPTLLEIDVVNCSITNDSLVEIFSKCRELRELKVNQCQFINDYGFIKSPLATTISSNEIYFDQLRILDLTNVVMITDRTVDCITQAAPKIRNLIFNKCVNITDKGIGYLSRLGRYLHYIHLGSCRHITDEAVIHLASKCTRIRYIDLASCHKLGDDTVIALAALPKLKRIGLVKCTRITNRAIMALTRNSRTSVSLERIHLSYCDQLTVQAISVLVIHCRRLTHLSLSFVPAFQHQEFQQFCRPPPKEYNAEYQRAFCVFSGQNVHTLRSYFKSSIHSGREFTRRLYYNNNNNNTTETNSNRIDEIGDNLQRVHIVN